jgi:hypothetical protein
MNLLDENFPVLQRIKLRAKRVPVRHIGYDIGKQGMKDERIIPFLLTLPYPTFFTLDADYFKRRLCHARYCLVHLDVLQDEANNSIRRFLRHPQFDTQAKRMGAVVRVSFAGLTVWRQHAEREIHYDWTG